MTHKEHVKALQGFGIRYQMDTCEIILHFNTPEGCDCGYPHASIWIMFDNMDDVQKITDFSVVNEESYHNVLSIVQMLTQSDDFYEVLDKEMKIHKSLKKSLVDSE